LGNFLNQNITVEDVFFDTGTWYQSWSKSIRPVSIEQGVVANKQGSIMSGVSGGIRLKIEAGNGNGVAYGYIGFSRPYMGSSKLFADIRYDIFPAKYASDNLKDNYLKLKYFDGYKIRAEQRDSSLA